MLRALPEAEPHELPSAFGTDDPVAGDRRDEPVDGGGPARRGGGGARDRGAGHPGAGVGGAGGHPGAAAGAASALGQLGLGAACTPTTGSLSASVVRVDGSDGFDGDLRGGGFGGLLRGPVTRTPAVLTQKRGGREDHRVIGTRGSDLVADGTELEVGRCLLQSG